LAALEAEWQVVTFALPYHAYTKRTRRYSKLAELDDRREVLPKKEVPHKRANPAGTRDYIFNVNYLIRLSEQVFGRYLQDIYKHVINT